MKKMFALLIVVITIVAMLAGCSEIISEETVQMTVTAKYTRAGTERYYTGSSYQYRTVPAKYQVIFDGKTYTVPFNQGTDLVAENDGCELIATFEMKTYDNGKVVYELISVDELAES